MSSLEEHLTPALLKSAISFWFSHLTSEQHLVAPPREAASRWFQRDGAFDNACL
ncbi:hypothetical protein NKR19_g9919, partial [Coniochaeta hoffmannii]